MEEVAVDAVDAVDAVGLTVMLSWHLGHNHYPPVPSEMVGPCIEAITAVNEGDPVRVIDLPKGITLQGESQAAAYQIVEDLHLDGFVDWDSIR